MDVQAIFDDALENNYALPAVNVVGTNSVNAVIETAAELNSPVMVQFSNGGGIFYAGKSLSNEGSKLRLLDRFRVLCMFMLWLRLMMYLLFFTLTMLLENCFLGLMACWMLEKSFTKQREIFVQFSHARFIRGTN